MKVVNLKFTEIHDIKTSADIQIANTVRFTNDERESIKNTLKEIKQYNLDTFFEMIDWFRNTFEK